MKSQNRKTSFDTFRRFRVTFVLVFLLLVGSTGPAYAADGVGLIFRGVAKTLVSVFQLPASILKDSMRSFPLGLISGTVNGTFRTVMGTLSGGVDIARGAAPYAKYLVFL